MGRSPKPAPAQVPTGFQGKGLGFAVPGQELVQAVTPGLHVFEPGLWSCFSRELRAGLPWNDVPDCFCGGNYLLQKILPEQSFLNQQALLPV